MVTVGDRHSGGGGGEDACCVVISRVMWSLGCWLSCKWEESIFSMVIRPGNAIMPYLKRDIIGGEREIKKRGWDVCLAELDSQIPGATDGQWKWDITSLNTVLTAPTKRADAGRSVDLNPSVFSASSGNKRRLDQSLTPQTPALPFDFPSLLPEKQLPSIVVTPPRLPWQAGRPPRKWALAAFIGADRSTRNQTRQRRGQAKNQS